MCYEKGDAMKNVLVTGGAGYIGSVLTRLLLNNNFNVIVIDNLTYGVSALTDIWHNSNFNFLKGDITSSKTIKKVFTDYQINFVVHLAAIVGDPACAKNKKLARKVNWNGSLKLLELCLAHRVKKFIFASTCSNYGKMPSPDGYVDENSPLTPISFYAQLKARFEKVILEEIKKEDGFCPVALRFATAYGVSPRMRFDLTVNEFTKELILGRELEVFGEQFWRPYCHVYDLARAVCLVLSADHLDLRYEVFNVGDSGENYQKKMIINELSKIILNSKVKFVHRDEDPRDYKVSFKKIQNRLGFNISKRVTDGIKEIKVMFDSNAFLDPDDAVYRNS